MAKVYGQDIPSKFYDTYHNFFNQSYDQSHQPYGKTVKKSNWDFPGYPFHPHFPSPAQLYVRAIFKSATQCWHLQPDTGGATKPDVGPRGKEWWELEADKDRTFGYRKFMSDTLLYKFRIGEPTWCMPIGIPATYVSWDNPDDNFCEDVDLYCNYKYFRHSWWIYLSRPPEDHSKQFFNIYAWHMYPQGSHDVIIDAFLPELFVFDPCGLTWNTRPGTEQILSQHVVLGLGWYKFWVGPYEQIYLRIEFRHFDAWDPDFFGGLIFYGPKNDNIPKRPFFSFE